VSRIVLVAVTLLLSACGATAPTATAPDPAWPGVVSDPSTMPLAEFGQLAVFTTGLTTDGRNLHLRALIGNPYPDEVEGVRVVFEVLSRIDEAAPAMDQFQRDMDVTLASGQRTPLRWDLQTMYAGSGSGGFRVQAFAVKRGDKVLPPPPGWKGS